MAVARALDPSPQTWMPHFPRSADTRIANSRAPQSIPNRHPPSLHAFSSFRSRCGSKEEDLSHSKVPTSPCRGRNQGFEHGTTGLKVLRWDGSMIHAFGRVIRMGGSQLRGFRVVQKCHDRSSGVGPIYRDPRPTTLPFHGLFGQDGGEGGSQDTARHIQPRRRLQTAPLSKLESGRFKNGTGKHPVERHHSCNMDSANQKRDVKASELSSRSTSLKVAHRFQVQGRPPSPV